ncbi:YheC/YheD family protein [Paenibacillus flagellatus]|uniref:ATP-grasp domain-containing protein n=1 Tax=Paenibacillus flagellatus TaxID=2211139 RepID=A0A2V5K470_9BACL|nr:YheC/YheD family protein [Paenibacillus flagellatus]PYI52704.1 hypothetical protein DLM86_20085 [Paenibacillus flagellatus]
MPNSPNAVSSKLVKTRLLVRDRELSRHVPDTREFARRVLAEMLDRYGLVYLKPDTGSLGVGVMRIEKRGREYRCQSGVNMFAFRSVSGMFGFVRSRMGGRRYLIQQGIRTLTREGRPFDFRVMIQKNPSRRWEPTGTVGRVARPRKAVTNGSQGGTIFRAVDLLRPFARADGADKAVLRRMDRLARRTAARFGRAYPAMNELGLDIAVDRRLYPWILEVNTRPDPCPFTKLDDNSAIRKIVAYGRAYGRKYELTCSRAKKAPKPDR